MRALILAPTRELAAQIGDNVGRYAAGTPLRHLVIFGGVGKHPQIGALRRGVDVLIATRIPLMTGCVVRARPIGVLLMEDEAGLDEKIISVPVDKLHPYYRDVSSYRDLPKILLDQISHFFAHYKDLEPDNRRKVGSASRAYERGWQNLVELGVGAGEFRDCDARRAVLGLLGMMNGTFDWFDGGEADLAEIGEQYADLILNGLGA